MAAVKKKREARYIAARFVYRNLGDRAHWVKLAGPFRYPDTVYQWLELLQDTASDYDLDPANIQVISWGGRQAGQLNEALGIADDQLIPPYTEKRKAKHDSKAERYEKGYFVCAMHEYPKLDHARTYPKLLGPFRDKDTAADYLEKARARAEALGLEIWQPCLVTRGASYAGPLNAQFDVKPSELLRCGVG